MAEAKKEDKPLTGKQIAGKVAGIAGNLATAYGNALAGDTKVTPGSSGYQSLPDNVKQFMMDELFPGIIEQYNAPRPAPMMRQYTEAEAAEPIFGSPTRLYMQNTHNYSRVPQQSFATSDAPVAPLAVDAGASANRMQNPGWNEATKTYQTPFGQQIRGDNGRMAAENASIEKMLMGLYGQPGVNSDATRQRIAGMTGAFTDGKTTYENPYNKLKYDRAKMLEALMMGDTTELQNQYAASSYDPRPGLLSKVAPYIAGGMIGAPLAAAGFSPIVSKVASSIGSEFAGAM